MANIGLKNNMLSDFSETLVSVYTGCCSLSELHKPILLIPLAFLAVFKRISARIVRKSQRRRGVEVVFIVNLICKVAFVNIFEAHAHLVVFAFCFYIAVLNSVVYSEIIRIKSAFIQRTVRRNHKPFNIAYAYGKRFFADNLFPVEIAVILIHFVVNRKGERFHRLSDCSADVPFIVRRSDCAVLFDSEHFLFYTGF